MEIRGLSFDGRSRDMVDADSTELHMTGAARHTVPATPVEMSPTSGNCTIWVTGWHSHLYQRTW